MKPFDIKGEYTPEEVKAALAGVSGTRQLSYRYERLDKNNNFIEDVDYVQSCTIENNALADIKRTAKMDVLDTGSIDYLKDRIKPYARIAMPEDETYADYVKTLKPMYWWKMDDPIKTVASTAPVTVTDAVNYNTRAAAYVAPNTVGAKTRPVFSLQSGSGTVRSEFWMSYNNLNTDALVFNMKKGTGQTSFEIHYSTSTTDSLTLVASRELTATWAWVHRIPFPKVGYYWVRMVTTSTTLSTGNYVETFRPVRLEDSSGHGIYGVGNDVVTMKASAIIADGGTAMSTPIYNSPSWGASNLLSLGVKTEGGFSASFWDHVTTANQYTRVAHQWGFEAAWVELVRTTEASGTTTVRLYVNSYDTSIVPNFDSSEVLLESIKYTHNVGHMTTLTLDPVQGFKLYIDSVEEVLFPNVLNGSSTNVQAFSLLFDDILDYVASNAYSDSAIKFDDTATFNRALSSQEVASLYSKAMTTVPDRSGYVEWPQGVFVLSSPTRKMVNGNTVVRSVDCYDQLVTLKEDTFDYRYFVAQGYNYSQAVKDVLQSTVPVTWLPLNSKWSINTSTIETFSEDAFRIPLYNAAKLFIGDNYSIRGASVQSKIVFTGNSTARLNLSLQEWNGNNNIGFYLEGGTLWTNFKGVNGTGFVYSPTNHAYWRIRESNNVVFWEVSADGLSWNTLRYELHGLLSDAKMLAMVVGDRGISTDNALLTKFRFEASKLVETSMEKSTRTLPSALEWESGTPKLTIINELLGAINFTSATYDEDGVFISKPYISPQNRASQFRYATDGESVMVGDIDQTVDVFAVPNKWVLVVSEPDRPALTGTYTNNDPTSPTSVPARGRTIVDFRTEQNAADQATLDAQAARLAFEASQVYEVIEFNTANMPIHQDTDVYELVIDGLAVSNKYAEHSWSMTLANGSSMRHRARRVVSI